MTLSPRDHYIVSTIYVTAVSVITPLILSVTSAHLFPQAPTLLEAASGGFLIGLGLSLLLTVDYLWLQASYKMYLWRGDAA